jgi:hypothetical protein
MADGNFYVDSRAPWLVADTSALSILTTDSPPVPLANLPVMGSNYWWVGKLIRIRMFGRLTTGTTPGTLTWDIYWGSGAAAIGTLLASSAAITLSASQTNLAWELELFVRCRALGASAAGSLLCLGMFSANVGVVASTLQPVMIPASAPAAVGVDTTAANVISPQVKCSVTGNSMTVHEYMLEAMN